MLNINKLHILTLAAAATLLSACSQQYDQWPDGGNDAKPCARWWWMGSAVDSTNLHNLIAKYADSGLGGLELCPIYGVQGNDSNDIPFLSPEWMAVYNYAREEAASHGMTLDMTCGTGWPFGGPNVTPEYSAARLDVSQTTYASDGAKELVWDTQLSNPKHRREAKLIGVYAYNTNNERVDITTYVNNDTLTWTAPAGDWNIYALWHGHTFQMVKRAAPGGEGFVMDYFSPKAVNHYLARFDTAFAKAGIPWPKMMFSDSYEVYGADYTADMFAAFEKQHGYDVLDYLPQLLTPEATDTARRVKADYCETVDSLLRCSFMQTWTEWLHSHGSTAREQAHGSVGNLLDLYALSETPECETYGRAKVKVRDLVVPDTFQRKNESDKAIMKFASSAAHTMGKPYTSAEALTWATEHFRMTPALCKPELDALFLAGINRIFYHGAAYSPEQDAWPGWKFYASVDYSPTNVFWPELKHLNKYVERCLTFLQAGQPDADVLVYLPMYDIWYNQNTKYLPLSIERLQIVAADFMKVIDEVETLGYQTDYISDRQILELSTKNNKLITAGGAAYKTIVVPNARFMHAKVLEKLVSLAESGATVIFAGDYPSSVPGLSNDGERAALKAALDRLPKQANGLFGVGNGCVGFSTDVASALKLYAEELTVENMTVRNGLRYIRRSNKDGYTYFIANLDTADIDAKSVSLAVDFADAVFYNPLDGKIGRAQVNADNTIRIQLESGQTTILRTYNKKVEVPEWSYVPVDEVQRVQLANGWTMRFVESTPEVDLSNTYNIDTLVYWNTLPDSAFSRNSATAVYTNKFTIPAEAKSVMLRLKNVKEVAEVAINGKPAISLWSMPFVADITNYVVAGDNTIEIKVKGSAANLIAQMDRDGVKWRKYKDTNLLDVKGKRRDYAWWPIEDMGLQGPVTLEIK